MMTSEGGTSHSVGAAAPADPNLLENYQAEGNQGQMYQYYPPGSASTPASWPGHGVDQLSTGNGTLQSYSYQYHQQPPSNVQDSTNASTASSTLTPSVQDNASYQYTNYATYPITANQSGNGTSEYASFYGNQHQPSQTYSQAQGAYQNSVSPYQPISSFQSTGSYAEPTSYSSTYYVPGDYQTSGAYSGSSYSSQTNCYANYQPQPQPQPQPQYADYSQDTSSTYASNNAAATNYHEQYKQWADYYSSQTEVTCAPGTESTAVANAASQPCPVPGVSSGYMTPVCQPQSSYAPAWKPEPSPSEVPSAQTAITTGAYNDYWKHAAQAYQSQHVPNAQSNFQKPLDVHPTYPNVQDSQQTMVPQVSTFQYTEVQPVQQTHQQALYNLPATDTHSVNKFQISANPRIGSNFALGVPKSLKEPPTSNVFVKPAYVSVSLPNKNNKALSGSTSDSTLKAVFPPSLRGYVERALARCKDEKQRAACQEVMKEMITKATTDGTLHSRDWDTEPLFPLPDSSTMSNVQSVAPVLSFSAIKRSPSRRTKSRWEPLPEDKPVEKPTSTYQDSVRQGGWSLFNGKDQKFIGGKAKRKDVNFSKFSMADQNHASRSSDRPAKRQRFSTDLNATESGDASSDSDKEQNLTAYYSGAIALADSPEEMKRRESRSKRFDKGNGQRTEIRLRPRKVGAGNLYTRRATALALSKTFEDGGSKAVEDIDWDALTVKGTSQEIEKRYLRLTSAPDPSTVRPEEVLEKALLMVQNSEKNYLYKCDQLKSIRQDLTVQRIHNELTVRVYETHARIALEYGDFPEFNQCLSQLKSLYGDGISGCHMEFYAYHLLSVMLHANNRRELLSSMSRLSVEARRHEAVKHAFSVRAAVTSGNYVMFFKLYKTAPNLNTCLMDLCIEKMRFEAVKCMSRSYRPTVPVSHVAQVLGFSNVAEDGGSDENDADVCEECTEWLKAHGACLISDNGEMMLDGKVSSSSLFMPEPEDAVAHGDANLAVNDFFARAPS